MSYTCFVELSVTQQETGSLIPIKYKSVVFPSFIVTSKKHYVGMRRDEELYTKGMIYIRRSGSRLSSMILCF
jgi:DNA polymerase elongation subunit (family B)